MDLVFKWLIVAGALTMKFINISACIGVLMHGKLGTFSQEGNGTFNVGITKEF